MPSAGGDRPGQLSIRHKVAPFRETVEVSWMHTISRRRLLRQLVALTAAGWGTAISQRAGRTASSPAGELWAHDAAGLRVSRGPWPTPTVLPPGVRFESLLLRMPDGVRIAALLFISTRVRRGPKAPCTLHVVPYRHSPDMGAYLSMGYLAQHGYAEL